MMKIHTVELRPGAPELHEVVLHSEHLQALARVEAENASNRKAIKRLERQLDAALDERDTAQAQLAEAVVMLHRYQELVSTIDMGSTAAPMEWCSHFRNEVKRRTVELGDFLARHAQAAEVHGDSHTPAQAEQQEVQGAQAGDEPVGTFKSFEALLKNIEATWFAGADLIRSRDVAQRAEITQLRAALATQPAAGEPEQQTAINADDLPTKKYPLGAFEFDSPADAPVAAGEPIQVEAVAVTREGDDGLYLDWVLEGGISALEAPGVVLLVAHGTVTDDQGSGEVYLAPPAAAHGHEAVLWGLLDESVNGGDEQQVMARAKIRHLVAMRAQAGEGGE